MKAVLNINPMYWKFSVWVFSEKLTADLFQGELPLTVAVYANPILLTDVLFGVAFIIVCPGS